MPLPIRVGLIGASADPTKSWGARAHIPALLHLPQYELTGVCTSRPESAQAAAARFGAKFAFFDPQQMVEHPEIDLVVVSVRAPAHKRLLESAIDARKHVLCEWPTCGNTHDAEMVARQAADAGVMGMVGLQAYGHETLRYVRALIQDGFVGRVLSTNWQCYTPYYGPSEYEANAYSADVRNNANLLRIATGHALSALNCCIAEFRELSATMATQHRQIYIRDTGKSRQKTAPDQIVISGILSNEAVAAIHMMGGATRTAGTRVEINGTEGDLLLTSAGEASIQRAPFELRGGRNGTMDLMPVPTEFRLRPPGLADGPSLALAHLYDDFANAYCAGMPVKPDFAEAVRIHKVLDSIAQSSRSGTRQIIAAEQP